MLEGGYQQKYKDCPIDRYGSYSTFELAKKECSLTSTCGSVFDNKCDDKAPFSLCPSKAYFITSTKSCLYEKQGMLQIILIADVNILF